MKAAAVTSNGMRGAIAGLQRTPGQRVPRPSAKVSLKKLHLPVAH